MYTCFIYLMIIGRCSGRDLLTFIDQSGGGRRERRGKEGGGRGGRRKREEEEGGGKGSEIEEGIEGRRESGRVELLMKAVSCAIQPGILFQLTLPLRGEYTWNALPPLSPPLPPPLLPPHLVLVGPMEHNNTTRQYDELSLIPRTVWELPSFPGHSQILSHSCGEKSDFSPQLETS